MPALPLVLATGLIAASATGCVFLDSLLGIPPIDPNATIPPFPFETAGPPAYTTGRATLTISGEGAEPSGPVTLDELASANVEADLGVLVVWENADGWYLTFTSFSDVGADLGSYLSVDRIVDHKHWTIVDPTRCLTTTTQSDAGGLVGTATCRGARWADFFSAYQGLGFPQPLPDQPPFDAEITFEAH